MKINEVVVNTLKQNITEWGRVVKGVNTTDDVDIDEISVQAKKFGNIVDKDGRPPLLQTNNSVSENFADGKKPGRKGLSKRVGIPKDASVSELRKIAKNSTGERRRMAHWQANMKSGKKKASNKRDRT